MDPNTLITEARAKIIWGDSSDSVRSFLIVNGMPASEADERIREFNRERNNEIRKLGLRDTFIGVVVLAVSGLLLWLILARLRISATHLRVGRGVGVLVLGACYGLWKLINGLINLIRPQSEHESIPDI